ncbi:hypothetical protein [Thioclava kandeliae]|uniref:Uncharacterized protein n=1 Tax=Thioclava kandeliae TaxID=3070818 RepID=A0ABV1SMH3_9RHOB
MVEGLMKVGFDTDTPVLSVSLTPHNFQETPALIAFFKDHFTLKGREAAEAALGAVDAHRKIAALNGTPLRYQLPEHHATEAL